LKFRNIVAPSVCAFAVAFAVPTGAAAQVPTAASTSDTSSNGSSTGVGNAGSFGIGSGTSNATATATSNGLVDNSVGSVRNIDSTKIVADQDLQASNTNNQIKITGSPNSAVLTGNISVNGASFDHYGGILTNGWNTGPTGNAQAATNLSVYSSLSGLGH
jgi:hypothetical protein